MSDIPPMIDFAELTDDIKEALFDVHAHLDAVYGYADWYIHHKVPPRLSPSAFIGPDFRKLLERADASARDDQDRAAVKEIEQIARHIEEISRLMLE